MGKFTRVYGPNARTRASMFYIPAEVRHELGLHDGDILVWRIEQRGNKKVAVFEKITDWTASIEIEVLNQNAKVVEK